MATARRSLLFVPGSRPDRFDKALTAGADMVCVDLEDAVAPDNKAAARADAVSWLEAETGTGAARLVRINALSTRNGWRDLLAIGDANPAHGTVFLPKVDSAEELRLADAILTETASPLRLMALIESVEGLERAGEIAAATPRLDMVMFGAADLSAELGTEIAHEPLLYARSRVVHAARRAGIGAIDVPSLDFRNLDTVMAEAEAARALGFDGKAALHPSNVSVINSVFTPNAEEIAKAEAIIAVFEASETGLVVLDGKLIEKPVIRRMQKVLDAAAAAKANGA